MECVMNNNRIFKSKIIFTVLLFVFTTLFFSCKNFLEGGDVKEAIDKAIYIANNECPEATLEEPVFQDGGLPKNRAIIITFTKSINTETFDDNFFIEDTKGNSLKEYFLKPEWSNENKYVKIAANEQKLIDFGKQDTMDIIVRLTRACTTSDELPITKAINHKYRIKNEIDNKPPEFVSLKAQVPEEYIARRGINGPLVLKEGRLPDITPNTTPTEEQRDAEKALLTINHINNKFDIYIEGNDYGGGMVQGHIKYRQLYDSMGEIVSSDEEEVYVTLTKNEDNENYKGEYLLDLSDEKYTDGLYEIKVTVQDAYNFDSTDVKIFNVVRDTIFAYRSNTRFSFSSSLHRNDLSENVTEKEKETGIKEGWFDPNFTPPTAKTIEEQLKDVAFSNLPQDIYYQSKLTGVTYYDDFNDYRYFVSWGLDLNDLYPPIELIPYDWAWEKDQRCPLDESFHDFALQHKERNLIMQATIKDGAGNDNFITILYPKEIDFHNYIISDDDDGKKKVDLYFEDMTKADYTKIANLPDRQVRPIYRVFYGKLEENKNDEETELQRNTAVPLEQDHWSDISDLHTIKNLDTNSYYVVYVQVEYKTFSVLTGEWVGESFGPLSKHIIDTSISGSAILEEPEFTIKKKERGEINTGLFNVTVKIDNFDEFAESVKFVPCYSTDGENWIYYDSHTDSEFTFTVTNPLRAPFETTWAVDDPDVLDELDYWDAKWDSSGNDNTYFDAVKYCTEQFGYPSVKAKLKILAVSETDNKPEIKESEIRESEIKEIEFEEDDDNIPPFVTSNVTQHDSRLSYDGHFYQFENIVREEEGHLSEYFNYYYAPYQESWGDNLSVMEPEEIETLPGGIGTFYSSCYKNETYDAENNKISKAAYTIDVQIPVNGLADGKYMFFAKVTDTYGNYAYITLGKADIGTFKNKMTVEYDHEKRTLISTLPIDGDERFDRNMIHIQDCWNDDDNNMQTEWSSTDGYFQYLNQLQNCELTTINGKTVLLNDNSKAKDGDFIDVDWSTNPGTVHSISPRELRGNCFYKIIMQGFNENYYNGTTGVNRKYGRPYSKFDSSYTSTDNNPYLWISNVVNYIDGSETEYDLCTEETVSNTVYYYIPEIDDEGNLKTDYLNDIKSSFFTDTATPRSNKPYLVNVIASGRDLGNDADEWERRGKLIKSHLYEPWRTNEAYNNFNTFDSAVAAEDMFNSHEKGLVYYVAVVHFADGKTALSNVYTMQGF